MFEALADPTRRAVLRDVADAGPRTATELAAELPISRQAVAKHLAVLREAGLVAHERAGRESSVHRHAGPARRGRELARPAGTAWDDRLARLDAQASRAARRPSTSRARGPARRRRPSEET